ncbi:MAG: tRNA (N(6)-L-threonylcarbamoyladenosine(37)-C(2))-methylthiotransferase MtaB [Cytophagia bacterium]|nr:tRNA (N(6)-L-threonylcarbamoyladenosine(37)-C(2))-methylthiotransferase MtaB [Cytophagia bacterium]
MLVAASTAKDTLQGLARITEGKPPRVAVYTLGCKLNYADGLSIRKTFEDQGYEPCNFEEGADVYIINTCSVTDKADRKCAKVVRQALRYAPHAQVAVVGCYAQLRPEEIAQIPGVTLVAGTVDKWRLPQLLPEGGTHRVVHRPIQEALNFEPAQSWGDRTRAFLKVQDGCDYPCSYCTIPAARGLSRSDRMDSVVQRARDLVKNGAVEIVLTGVNLGDFGRGKGDRDRSPEGPRQGLDSLVRRLNDEVEVERFRLSSVEPNLLDESLLVALKESPRFVPHFHIPLQSGSDTVLARMRRRYRTELYRDRLNRIIELFPEASIGADVMVGFPGETEEEFMACKNFLDSLPLAYLHVFSYSERPGTDAMAMGASVSMEQRAKRNQDLTRWSLERERDFALGFRGRTLSVLFENEAYAGSNGSPSTMRGYTPNYLRVEAVYDPLWAGSTVPVYLDKLLPGQTEIRWSGTILA